MRVSSDVSIQKRYRQLLSEDLNWVFSGYEIRPEIYRARLAKTQVY